jgi:hypothetical protein
MVEYRIIIAAHTLKYLSIENHGRHRSAFGYFMETKYE